MTMRNIVSVLFLLSISQLQMVHCICTGEQYVVKMPDNSTKCQPCYECHAGYGRYPICGSEVNYPVDSGCRPCGSGTFSDKDNAAPCKKCHQCAIHEKHTSPCTNTSDTVCSGTCEVGYYFTKKAPLICQKCSCCFNDEKDEPQQECKEHGLKEHCSLRHDRHCVSVSDPSASPNSTKSTEPGLNKTGQIILGVLGAIVVIVLIVAVLWMIRRKQNTCAEGHAWFHTIPEEGHSTSCTGTVSANGQPQFVRNNSRENPSYSDSSQRGTPQLSTFNLTTAVPNDSNDNPQQSAASGGHEKSAQQASRHSQNSQGHSTSCRETVSANWLPQVAHKGSIENPSYNNSQPGTPQLSTGNLRTTVSNDSLDNPQQSASSGGHGTLLDSQNSQVPEIERHPQSQTVKEGSRIEFTCKVHGENVLYEWLKDGTELTGKYEKGLIIDPVKMADFGQYTCRVRYKAEDSSKKSSPEELDVEPCQGREYTHLSAISDFDTLAKVEGLLNRRGSVRCCKTIGQKYGMERYKIDDLEDSEHRGKDVMAFLRTAHPDLTAYDFCKQLKKFQRNDVVKLLEKHLASEVKSSKDEYQ